MKTPVRKQTIKAVDLFCGAGGTSTGIIKAATERLHRDINLVAVNHWQTAINSHSLNHPFVKHLCEPVENIHPLDLVKDGRLDLLAASCECRFHSNARGGGPCNEQSRAQPWQIIRWATDIRVDNIMMENVREFRNWGPLNPRTKRPIKSKKGQFFNSFLNALDQLGYTFEYRIQNAADFGDATERHRLILIATHRKAITWPRPSHGPDTERPHRIAREIIDRSIRGKSIFTEKRFPCENTVNRMIEGFSQLLGKEAEPVILMLRGTTPGHLRASVRSLEESLPTITAGGNHFCLAELIVQTDQTGGNGRYSRTTDRPLPTIVTKQNLLLVEMILKYYGKGNCKPLDEPLDTITTRDRFALVQCHRDHGQIDILTRMLQPHELAAAHSFPTNYKFLGTKADQTKQIGNSVPVELAAAHAQAILS